MLIFGLFYYGLRRKTPPASYQALINVFAKTSGRSNDLLSTLIAKARPAPAQLAVGLPSLFPNDIKNIDGIVATLKDQGYVILGDALPVDCCDRILKFAMTSPLLARGDKSKVPTVYPRQDPTYVRYEFMPGQILGNELFNDVLLDPLFVQAAARYLGTVPILDVLGLWWHTGFAKVPDSEAAQLFHFDMDRIKWLKIFIYMTDVSEESGPHCFVASSHRSGGIPKELLKFHYARLTDEQVVAECGRDRLRTFTGRRGTVILEDTRGLHKGQHVESGDRLMFQSQFSNSLFGAYYEPTPIPASNPQLRQRIAALGIRSFFP